MESVVRSRDLGVEAKMKDGQDELKQQLEDGMKRHGARMEDMGDQYMESSDAVRRAEDRINDMQEEVRASCCRKDLEHAHVCIAHASAS